jgi:hypothetical protein
MSSLDPYDPIDVLLVEDDAGDVLLIREAFEHNKAASRRSSTCAARGPTGRPSGPT